MKDDIIKDIERAIIGFRDSEKVNKECMNIDEICGILPISKQEAETICLLGFNSHETIFCLQQMCGLMSKAGDLIKEFNEWEESRNEKAVRLEQRLKHCNNYLERKQILKELNILKFKQKGKKNA